MYVVKYEFEDKYTGKPIRAGTILELEDGDRKDYLLKNQMVEKAVVIKLPNSLNNTNGEATVTDLTTTKIKKKLDAVGIKYDKRAKKDELLALLKEIE